MADIQSFKYLLIMATMYGAMSLLVYYVVNMKLVKPLEFDAPLHLFSESRAIEHVRILTQEGRQEGRVGLRNAAKYIKSELTSLRDKAGSNISVLVEEDVIMGSFNMLFLGHSISLAYRNHSNILMRLASTEAKDDDPSVLINGHYDSTLNSPGAGDCASCVASMIELARVIVDTNWVPPRPILFLFNGAEELFMLGSHGFMNSNKWRDSIGASINLEASGTGGLDLVCQSGPNAWPAEVYSRSALYPMAHSAAQDVFKMMPGDTDYRMFSEDYGDIPSLDIIFILGGYYYHTSFDTVDKLIPGSIQARGENLLRLLKAFSGSSKLLNSSGRKSVNEKYEERGMYFDYLTLFMIYVPRLAAAVIHVAPVGVFFGVLLFRGWSCGIRGMCVFLKGILFHANCIILGICFPLVYSVIRLMMSPYAMNWFSRPYLAFIQFIPCSLIGLLLPRFLSNISTVSQNFSDKNNPPVVDSSEGRFWGTFGFYSFLSMIYLLSGLNGGFLSLLASFSLLITWPLFESSIKSRQNQPFRVMVAILIPMLPFLLYSVYFGGVLVQFVIEKMGMIGSFPPPTGYFIHDMVVASVVGVVTGWCAGPILPVWGNHLAKSSVLRFFAHLTLLVSALSLHFFPYNTAVPKRVVLQQSFVTLNETTALESSYELSVVDSNSLLFLFKYVPEVAQELQLSPPFSFQSAKPSHRENWMAIYPVSFLFSKSMKFPAMLPNHHRTFPHLSVSNSSALINDHRRVHLDLSLGDLEEIWVTVLNITGPLSSWSFADTKLPAPEFSDGGPPSYICRLSGSSDENWSFWLEANGEEGLRVDVAVLDQILSDHTANLKGLFPNWVDVVAYSSYMSSYIV